MGTFWGPVIRRTQGDWSDANGSTPYVPPQAAASKAATPGAINNPTITVAQKNGAADAPLTPSGGKTLLGM